MKLIDPFNRQIDYVRVSITDRCNYKCDYCMPKQGAHPEGKFTEYLSFEEHQRILFAFADLGVNKIRITGGEPLVRKGVAEFVKSLNQHPNIQDISLSTNAERLAPLAAKFKAAGLKRVNISLDTLDSKKFYQLTHGGNLTKVIEGIEAAVAEGLTPVKLNMVVMKGINDEEIPAMLDFAIAKGAQLRFIEVMPIGSAGIDMMKRHLPADQILQRVKAYMGASLIPSLKKHGGGPARYYQISGTQTEVGMISAVSQHFCETCNRVRLDSRGILALCLGQNDQVDFRTPLRQGISDEALKQLILDAIARKPERHFFNEDLHRIEVRNMSHLGG